jgi:hypothetical protein
VSITQKRYLTLPDTNAEDKELAEYTPRTKSAERQEAKGAQRKKTRI